MPLSPSEARAVIASARRERGSLSDPPHDPTQTDDAAASERTRPRATVARDRVAVVVNGNAKRVTDDLVDTLDQIVRSGDLYVSRSLDEAREIARTIVERGYPTVLTAGGDGTFVQMVTMVTEETSRAPGRTRPRFGLLKLGTGNALAWVLGAGDARGRGVIADLARLRKEGGSRRLRLLDVEGLLTPFAGLGIDAVCLEDYRRTKETISRTPVLRRFASGGLTYAVSIAGVSLPGYLVRPHPHVRIVNEGSPAIRLDADGRVIGEHAAGEVLWDGPSRIVGMSTIPYWGFGARIFPFAEEREDRFSLRVADLTSLDVALGIRKLWRGTFRKDTLHDLLVDRISIHFGRPMPLQVGGDVVGSRTVVHARLADEPLEVVDYYAPPPV